MISGWTWLVIGLGGGAGAVARFLVARQMGHWLGDYLPYGTLTVNAIGSWMLGFLSVYLMDRPEISPLVRLGLAVGFLGAFTTFSTFSYE
ncbi:MAG TPA: CrcB family protein, partial [SAR324 cluster bacterium]|nr:CrcB family protein [SAR324 cluster bacterium]